VKEPTFVQSVKRYGRGDRESQKPSDFRGRTDKAVERLSSGIFEHEQSVAVLALERERSRRPRILQVVLQLIFVRETFEDGWGALRREIPAERNSSHLQGRCAAFG
jgi:hypothetical protein